MRIDLPAPPARATSGPASPSTRRGDLAVWWMVGFAAIHAVGAVAAALDVGPFTGLDALVANVVYTVVPAVGALVAEAVVHPARRRLPAWFVDPAAALGVVLLAFVGVLGTAHQLGWLVGAHDRNNVAAAAFELYVVAGAALYIPVAVAHLRRARRRPSQPEGGNP